MKLGKQKGFNRLHKGYNIFYNILFRRKILHNLDTESKEPLFYFNNNFNDIYKCKKKKTNRSQEIIWNILWNILKCIEKNTEKRYLQRSDLPFLQDKYKQLQ